MTRPVRVAGKGLKVAGFSASCEESVRVAKKRVRGAVASCEGRGMRQGANRSVQVFGEAEGEENMGNGTMGLARK